MIFPEIRSLFKYMPINANTLGCIIKNEYWFSKPTFFNDPLDCGIQLLNNINQKTLATIIHADITRQELKNKKTNQSQYETTQKLKDFLKKIESNEYTNSDQLYEDFQSIATQAIENYSRDIQGIGILSLSEINDNILMWSHYAEQHQGVCLELERSEDNILSNNNNTLPIRYSIKKPLITLSEEVLGDEKLKKEIKRSLVFTKSVDWSYEREWRVLQTEGNTLQNINSPLKRIYFGVKTSDAHKKTIANIVSGRSIELMEMQLKPNEFGLISTPYTKSSKHQATLNLSKHIHFARGFNAEIFKQQKELNKVRNTNN